MFIGLSLCLSLSLYIYIYMYIYIHTYVYIYIYIYREREREIAICDGRRVLEVPDLHVAAIVARREVALLSNNDNKNTSNYNQ